MHTIHVAPINDLRSSTIQRALKLLHVVESLNFARDNKYTINADVIGDLQVEAHDVRRLIEAELQSTR